MNKLKLYCVLTFCIQIFNLAWSHVMMLKLVILLKLYHIITWPFLIYYRLWLIIRSYFIAGVHHARCHVYEVLPRLPFYLPCSFTDKHDYSLLNARNFIVISVLKTSVFHDSVGFSYIKVLCWCWNLYPSNAWNLICLVEDYDNIRFLFKANWRGKNNIPYDIYPSYSLNFFLLITKNTVSDGWRGLCRYKLIVTLFLTERLLRTKIVKLTKFKTNNSSLSTI